MLVEYAKKGYEYLQLCIRCLKILIIFGLVVPFLIIYFKHRGQR